MASRIVSCTAEARVARYYDPGTAQFLTRDPLEARTQSAYGYVNGDPIDGADPSGLCWPDWACKAADAVLQVAAVPGYALYYAAYRTDSTIRQAEDQLPGPLHTVARTAMLPTHAVLAADQVGGLGSDVVIDGVKHYVGGERQLNDEGLNDHIFPFNLGPVWYLPGWWYDDACHVDFSWNHPLPLSRGFGPISKGDRP